MNGNLYFLIFIILIKDSHSSSSEEKLFWTSNSNTVQANVNFQFGAPLVQNKFCQAACYWNGKTSGHYLSNSNSFFAAFDFTGKCLCTCPVPDSLNSNLCTSSKCNSFCQLNTYVGGQCLNQACNCLTDTTTKCSTSPAAWTNFPVDEPEPDSDCDPCGTPSGPCVTKPPRPPCFPESDQDIDIPPFDDDYPIPVTFSFKYFGTVYNELYISDNGMISFVNPVKNRNPNPCLPYSHTDGPTPLIGAFWADSDYLENPGGSISYRISSTTADLNLAKNFIVRKFLSQGSLSLTQVLIVTYKNIGFYGATSPATATCPGTALRNTFQIILATSGTNSFVIICYDKIQWINGLYNWPDYTIENDPCFGDDGTPAEAAFDNGSGTMVKISPDSCQSGVIDIDKQSNLSPQTPGRFVFKVSSTIIG